MRPIIQFFMLLQVQAIACIPLAKWLHGQCTPMTTLIAMLSWLGLGIVTLGYLHTAVLIELRRRDAAKFAARRDS